MSDEPKPELSEELWDVIYPDGNRERKAFATLDKAAKFVQFWGWGKPILIGVHPRHRDESERQTALLAKIESKVDFLVRFVGVNADGRYELSSEHSAGEQIVALRKIVRQGKEVM